MKPIDPTLIDHLFIYFDLCTTMGEYPKRSEIQFNEGPTGEPWMSSVVEIKTDTRYGEGKNDQPNHMNKNWYGDDSHFRIDEVGDNVAVGEVIGILTNAETHPHGIKVEIITGDQGRVQRILTGEELKKYNIQCKIQAKRAIELTEEEREYEQSTKFFPKSEIPSPPETELFEFKTSFKTPTRPIVPDGQIKDPELLESVLEKKAKEKVPELKKMISNAVTALANTKGGKLFIGVNDDGKVVATYFKKELNDNWDKYLRGISDSIKELTDSTSFLSKLEFQPGEDDEFLVIHVKPGAKPYYVRNKGGIKEFYMRGSGKSEVFWMIIKKKDGLNYMVPRKIPVDGIETDGIIDGKD